MLKQGTTNFNWIEISSYNVVMNIQSDILDV
jgi:hypothetical protein